jgi:hypothetical protein
MTAETLTWILLALVALDLLALRFGIDSRFWNDPSLTRWQGS